MSASDTSPTVIEVLRFEDLPLGSRGTRRAIARWSDGTESEVMTWYDDLVGSARGAWAARHVLARLAWSPPAATSIRACGSPAHGSPTFFTVGIRLPVAMAGMAVARRWFRQG